MHWSKNPLMREKVMKNMPHYGIGHIPWNKGNKNCFSKETLIQMSESRKGQVAWNKGKKCQYVSDLWANPEWNASVSKKISESSKGKHFSEEHLKHLSEAHIGQISLRRGKSIEVEYGMERAKEIRNKIRQARFKQKVPTFLTKPEIKFNEICEKYNLPYKYTGDGSFWIENINPDFTNTNGEKIVVEIWGDYWHNLPTEIKRDKEKLEVLKKYGWRRIELWEHELNSLSQKEIIEKVDKLAVSS